MLKLGKMVFLWGVYDKRTNTHKEVYLVDGKPQVYMFGGTHG